MEHAESRDGAAIRSRTPRQRGDGSAMADCSENTALRPPRNDRRTRNPHPHSKNETFCVDGHGPSFVFCDDWFPMEAHRHAFPQFREAHSIMEQTNLSPTEAASICHLRIIPQNWIRRSVFGFPRRMHRMASTKRARSHGKRQIARKQSRGRTAQDTQELYSALPRSKRHKGSL